FRRVLFRSRRFSARRSSARQGSLRWTTRGVVHPTNAAGHATHSCHHPTDEADANRRAVGNFFPAAEAVCAAAPCGGQRVGIVHPTNAAGHATHSYHHPTDEADANRRAAGVFPPAEAVHAEAPTGGQRVALSTLRTRRGTQRI